MPMRIQSPSALLLCTVLCAALGTATAALAAPDGVACWARGTERLDYYGSPPERGDNSFFTTQVAQNGNVVLVYPNSASLNTFTQRLYRIRTDLGGPTPTGCTNAYLDGLVYFMPTSVEPPAGTAFLQGPYSSAKTYPDPETTYSPNVNPSPFQSDNFAFNKAYLFGDWPAGSTSGTGSGTALPAATACGEATATRAAECTICLATKGYWINPDVADNVESHKAMVVSGNFLNFHPPKWTLLRLAYHRLLAGPLLNSLRNAVMVPKVSGVGADVALKLLPQSCSGNGRPTNQRQSAANSIVYNAPGNPIAESLFNAAWLLGGQQGSWWFPNSGFTQPVFNNQAGRSDPCPGCNSNFVVVFSDGRSDAANPKCEAGYPKQPFCRVTASCSALGLGAEADGDDFLDPSVAGGTGAAITGAGIRQTSGGACDLDFGDDVARWMHGNDVAKGIPGTHVSTYVVAIGDPNNTYGELTSLEHLAASGNGAFVVASDFATLEKNIEKVFQEIISRSTSFSVAAITTVQTRGSTFAFIPRFRPMQGAQWEGKLLRFKLFNEFSAGCLNSDLDAYSSRNPNSNGSCNDLYLRDNNNAFVGEDANNDFVVLDNSQTWEGGLPDGGDGWAPKTGADGGSILAEPVWEASAKLTAREEAVIGGNSSQARTIYTVAPDGSGGWGTELVPITEANVSNVTPLLGLDGYLGDFCTSLSNLTRNTYTNDDACTLDVIRFLNGVDVLKQNPLNRTQPPPDPLHPRTTILGDIFHSSPVLVTSPAPTFLCDLGVLTQCLPSLYAARLTPGGSTAYQAYFTAKQYRAQAVLVGSNDGMLHAFHAGTDRTGDDPETPNVELPGTHYFDLGTGKETWAFIPPHLMAKLQRYVLNLRHDMLVDGTPLVRDIWVDGSGSTTADGVKQADEFHTVAIIGERGGGRRFTALDVSDPAIPRFLWAWPSPARTADLASGESWDDNAPGAPPIGPVAFADAGGPLTIGAVKARERWVFMTGGGFDPNLQRGRGLYMIDAWTGVDVWRFEKRNIVDTSDPRYQIMPIAAPVAMVDADSDGLFDTAVVGDVGGQVWVARFAEPGLDKDGDGRPDNWYAGRAFIQNKGGNLSQRTPFFQRAGIAKLPNGPLRAYLGSGSRDQVKDVGGGVCGLSNLLACIRKDCSVDVDTSTLRVGARLLSGRFTFSAGSSSLSSDTLEVSGSGAVACTDVAEEVMTTAITCGSTSKTYATNVYCDWGATSAGTECPNTSGKPPDTAIPYTVAAANLAFTQFYSIALFDTVGARAIFRTAAQAQAYDAAALKESDLVDADTGTATLTGNGWRIAHTHLTVSSDAAYNQMRDEKTASGSLLLGGCAVWNTLVPNPAAINACSATLPSDTAYLYQADAITGGIACGTAGSQSALQTVRSVARPTTVTPQQPTPVVALNPTTGQINYSGVSLEPGAPPLQITIGKGDVLGGIHWLNVPRSTHECRHNADATKCSQ